MTPLPWRPAAGQTALREIGRGADAVLCEDKTHFGLRTLWRVDGRLLAQGGKTLTLAAAAPAAAPLDAADRAILLLLPAWPEATLAGLSDYAALAPDKMLVRLLALERRGLVNASAETQRHWTLTPAGEAAIEPPPTHSVGPARTAPPPKSVPTPPPSLRAERSNPPPSPLQPVQMSLF